MTAPEAVHQFLTQNSGSACSDCIARELGIRSRAQPVIITAALATTSEFVREQGHCVLCTRHKMVTRRA